METVTSYLSSFTIEEAVKTVIAAVLLGSLKWIGLWLRNLLRGRVEIAIAVAGMLWGLFMAISRGLSAAPATANDVFMIVVGIYVFQMHLTNFGNAVQSYRARKRVADQPNRSPER